MAGSKRGQRRNNRETGSYYERMAGVYLTEKGYEILECNYRCRLGEIDIIQRWRLSGVLRGEVPGR